MSVYLLYARRVNAPWLSGHLISIYADGMQAREAAALANKRAIDFLYVVLRRKVKT